MHVKRIMHSSNVLQTKKLPYLKKRIKMKKLNKLAISFIFSVSADSVKTGGMTVMGDYTWAVAQMKVYYVASTKKVTGANTQVTYKFPAATNVVSKVTAVREYSASGKLTAKVSGVTKSDTVTVSTK